VIGIHKSLNENDGAANAVGCMVAIRQRSEQIAQQRQYLAAIRSQTEQLERADQIEANCAEIERKRRYAEEADREMRGQEEEQIKQLRKMMADSSSALNRLEKLHPNL
jgi:predicted transposase YbfD/YdcC